MIFLFTLFVFGIILAILFAAEKYYFTELNLPKRWFHS